MMKKILFLLTLSTACLANSIGEDTNAMAISLYKEIDAKGQNIAFSPFSIFSNLSLLYFGSGGTTAKQMQNALQMGNAKLNFLSAMEHFLKGLSTETKNGYTFSFANGLFVDEGTEIEEDFASIAKDVYDATIDPIDFKNSTEATKTINGWVSEETRGYIPEILQKGDIDENTRLVLANAVYFEGKWLSPFSQRKIAPGAFYPTKGGEMQVDMLEQNHYFPYYENDELQLVAFPFKRNGADQPQLQAMIVLPKEKKGLAALEEKLSSKELTDWIQSTSTSYMQVIVPKFCFSHRLNLNNALKRLGMEDAFTPNANFSKLSTEQRLYLSKVLHETFFSFNEKGVTAAAATSSQVGVSSAAPDVQPTIPFIADHPFLFLLIDTHSNAVLFMGRVETPSTSECGAA